MGEPGAAVRPPDYRIEAEPCGHRVRVVFGGVTVADTRRALLVRETRHAPVYYLPLADVRSDLMERTAYHTHCPFKGNAAYWTLRAGGDVAENAVWAYEDPLPEAEALRGHVAFTRNRMQAWYEEETEVRIDPVTDVHRHGNPHVDWLLRDAWEAATLAELVARLARQLAAAGVPVTRLALIVRTLHPQVMGVAHRWTRADDAVDSRELSHATASEEAFLTSPLVPIFDGRGGVRRRLEGPGAVLDFPILRALRDGGASDYAAMPLRFSDGRTHALTLATDRPGGFSVEELGHLHEVLPLLARLAEVHVLHRTAGTLLETYVGRHSGARVLEGSIRRGDGEVIPAAIWWADLRGSTALAESLPRERYLAHLNRFFEATAGAVLEADGEVLKFIGDAVLAIFPLRDRPDAPARALACARAALDRAARADAEPALEVALALHLGDVSYGNVGVPGRLDFTVTGPAVNQVARLEGVAKELGCRAVASAAFAERVPGETVSLGHRRLRGVREPVEVFTLRGLAGGAGPDLARPPDPVRA